MLEGSNDGGSTYRLIASNSISLPLTRNFGDGTQFLCDETGNNCLNGFPVLNQSWAEFDFLSNTNAYQTYRFSIPTTRGAGADRCEYGEIMFLGVTNSNPPQVFTAQPGTTNAYNGSSITLSATFTGTGSAVYQWARGTNGTYALLSDGGNVTGSHSPSLTINPVTFADAADYRCVATNTLARATSGVARLTVLSTYPNLLSGNSLIGSFGDASGGYWLGSDPTAAIDNDLNPYQNGGSGVLAPSGGTPFVGPVGLVMTPSINGNGSTNDTLVLGLRLFTAGPYYPERDPADYKLEGSRDAGATFSLISSGALNLPADRNAAFGSIDPLQDVVREALFPYNNQTYSVYRLTFNHTKNDSMANCLQVAEVQLLGVLASTVPVLAIQPGGAPGTLTISSSVPAELYSRTNLVLGAWVDEGPINGSVTVAPTPATPVKFYRAGVLP